MSVDKIHGSRQWRLRKSLFGGALAGVLMLLLPQLRAAEPAAPEEAPQAKPEATETKFLRVTRDEDDEPLALETAISSYRSAKAADALTVDLVGAVHIADASYFRTLNQLFTDYDVVLYELVAPEGTRVPKGGAPRTSGVSALQGGMTQVLNLAFQLDCVDYTQDYMVHADLSPAEFSQSMRERGESMSQIFFRMMGQSMAQQATRPAKNNDAKILAALFSRNRDLALKQVMAEQFEEMGGALDVLEGPDGSTLVSIRNQRALDVLKREIGKGARRIAIFYGAAHMPDMEKRLVDQFELSLQKQQWIPAWDLTAKAKK